jgi:hypothetical protein
VIWSFLLAAGSIFGIWLVSKNEKQGWRFSLFMEIPWSIWAIWLQQWGFLLLCVCYAGVYFLNMRKSILKEDAYGYKDST